MTLWELAAKSLRFYWRTNLAVLLSAAVATAVLAGALLVGNSVSYTLATMLNARLGTTELALGGQNRFFRTHLADELVQQLNTTVAPVMQLRGLVSNTDGSKRANSVSVLGVDERFYKIGGRTNPLGSETGEIVVLNEPLAAMLGVTVGDEIVLRVENPGAMPRDIVLMPDSDLSLAFRVPVHAVADEARFGRFSLQANQIAPLNAYVPIRWLQEKLGRAAQANLLLVAGGDGDISVHKAADALRKCWQPADAGLEIRRLDRQQVLELRSSRIFIEDAVVAAAERMSSDAVGILAYFVNELRLGKRAAPYSMVAAIPPSKSQGLIPVDMQDNEIVINAWLAEDLAAKPGDIIQLDYFVIGPARKLDRRKSSFKVRDILPLQGPALDPDLMPDFPGLAAVDNCRDWKPGIPIELDKIRKQDEDYWKLYRGTPKAFVTLKAGQAMWANRYGSLTAVRYPAGNITEKHLAEGPLNNLDPASLSLYFYPVRAHGEKASNQAADFGQLFLGFSAFLIIAALVLTALAFVFGVESRTQQLGLLLAVGLLPKAVKRLLLIEGAILAVLGSLLGIAAALLYTRLMIYGLATIWSSAVAGSAIYFNAQLNTCLAGALSGIAVSITAIWLTLRKHLSCPARELLAGTPQRQFLLTGKTAKFQMGLYTAIPAVIGAIIILAVADAGSSGAAAAFFAAGALLLAAGIGLGHALLKRVLAHTSRPLTSLPGLAIRNAARRTGRSMAVIAMLACGVFIVIAVGANRHSPSDDPQKRDSGTGGFTLFAQSAIPVPHDLNSDAVRRSLGLDEDSLRGVKFVQLRVREGDDASCFNLNRAQKPQLLGVPTEQLRTRRAFAFADTLDDTQSRDTWSLLTRNFSDNVIPAVGDYATVVWGLGKSIGDELEYADEKGAVFRLRIVAILKNSVLQGSLLIDEERFTSLFPSEYGYRIFLIDAPPRSLEQTSRMLSAALTDFGLELTPALQRLAVFSAVENTYLSIFQLLGGFGLILGTVGLGLVVLRNVLDRRSELAMMRAVGFCKGRLRRMLIYEHSGLVLFGLACGVLAALVAVSPAVSTPASPVPVLSLVLTVAALAVSSIVWIWMATVFATAPRMLQALRNE